MGGGPMKLNLLLPRKTKQLKNV